MGSRMAIAGRQVRVLQSENHLGRESGKGQTKPLKFESVDLAIINDAQASQNQCHHEVAGKIRRCADSGDGFARQYF